MINMKEVEIRKAQKADSRTSNDISKDELIRDTKIHIEDVSSVMNALAGMLATTGISHDHTKLSQFDDFYDSLNEEGDIKDSEWYKMHITTERHHLKSNVPSDVNLLDILEYISDCTVAGLSRSGTIYDLDLPAAVLVKAFKNTCELIKENIILVE